MKYLLDTCAISELIKAKPEVQLISWIDSQMEEDLYLSVITIGEIYKGINKINDPARQAKLRSWVDNDLLQRFNRRIIEVDNEIAQKWGLILGQAEQQGSKLPVIDALIAATAEVYHLTVITRNVSDLERCGAKVINPWQAIG